MKQLIVITLILAIVCPAYGQGGIPKNDPAKYLEYFCTKVKYKPGSMAALKAAWAEAKAAVADIGNFSGEWFNDEFNKPRNCLDKFIPDFKYRPPGDMDDLLGCFDSLVPTYHYEPPSFEKVQQCMAGLAPTIDYSGWSSEEITSCMQSLVSKEIRGPDIAYDADRVESELKRFIAALKNLQPTFDKITSDGVSSTLDWLVGWCGRNKKLISKNVKR